MINNGICTSCDHRHRGKNECSFCDCVWQHQEPEKISWLKKITTGLNKMMVKCKNCGHGCHCSEDKIDSEHYTPLMDLCECKQCLHEVKEIEYEECLSCQ